MEVCLLFGANLFAINILPLNKNNCLKWKFHLIQQYEWSNPMVFMQNAVIEGIKKSKEVLIITVIKW